MPGLPVIATVRLSFSGGRVAKHFRGPLKVGLILDKGKESVDRFFERCVYGQAYTAPGRIC